MPAAQPVWEQVPIGDQDRADLDEAQAISLRNPGDPEGMMGMVETMSRSCQRYGYDAAGAVTGKDGSGRTTLRAYRPARLN